MSDLKALQHGKLRRELLQLIGRQADVGHQQQLVQVAQGGQVLKENTALRFRILRKKRTQFQHHAQVPARPCRQC